MDALEKEQLAKIMALSKMHWWQSHHIKEELGVMHNMAEELEALFNAFGLVLLHKEALEIVETHAQAAMLHDIAEEFGDQGEAKEELLYWDKVYQLLLKYCKNLVDEIDRQRNEKEKH